MVNWNAYQPPMVAATPERTYAITRSGEWFHLTMHAGTAEATAYVDTIDKALALAERWNAHDLVALGVMTADLPLLPTPSASDCYGPGEHGKGGMNLRTAVMLLPCSRSYETQPAGLTT